MYWWEGTQWRKNRSHVHDTTQLGEALCARKHFGFLRLNSNLVKFVSLLKSRIKHVRFHSFKFVLQLLIFILHQSYLRNVWWFSLRIFHCWNGTSRHCQNRTLLVVCLIGKKKSLWYSQNILLWEKSGHVFFYFCFSVTLHYASSQAQSFRGIS